MKDDNKNSLELKCLELIEERNHANKRAEAWKEVHTNTLACESAHPDRINEVAMKLILAINRAKSLDNLK